MSGRKAQAWLFVGIVFTFVCGACWLIFKFVVSVLREGA